MVDGNDAGACVARLCARLSPSCHASLAVVGSNGTSPDADVRDRAWKVLRLLERGERCPEALHESVVDGLRHGDPSQRAAAADALGYTQAYANAPCAIRAVALLLEDPDARVATAAARRLWIGARDGSDMTGILPALERVLAAGPPHVRFYASLALANHLRRRGGQPPPVAWPADGSLPPIDEPNQAPGSSYTHWAAYAPREGKPPAAGTPAPEPPTGRAAAGAPRCALCGSLRLSRIHSDSSGSVAGGWESDEDYCWDCARFTIREHVWG